MQGLGADGVMTAYNSVNGEWAGQNEALMEGVLRGEWGFRGVTVSDFIWGLRDPARSLRAGLDVEEPFAQQRAQHLPSDLDADRVSWEHVDRAARRILRTQLAWYVDRDEAEPTRQVVFSEEHRALAREAAARSMVLLKNAEVDGAAVLPLQREAVQKVAVIGRLADVANTGDHGSSDVRAPHVVTPLEGLRAALPGTEFALVADDDPRAAAEAAAGADVAIVVAGYTAADEGEFIGGSIFQTPELRSIFPPVDDSPAGRQLLAQVGEQEDDGVSVVGSSGSGGDRESLRLRPVDVDIIRAVSEANPRTIVSVVTAGAVITEEWRDRVPAVLLSWYSGSEGGNALADVLLGAVDASGRLPFSIPTTEEHLPFFDRDATSITYDRWFGQRLLDRDGHTAAYPLGYGLSYTTFALENAEVGKVADEAFTVEVSVRNEGDRAGRHVVQVYGRIEGAEDDFPQRVLLGFAPISLDATETGRVNVHCTSRPLYRWTEGRFVLAGPDVELEIGSHATDPDALIARGPALPDRAS